MTPRSYSCSAALDDLFEAKMQTLTQRIRLGLRLRQRPRRDDRTGYAAWSAPPPRLQSLPPKTIKTKPIATYSSAAIPTRTRLRDAIAGGQYSMQFKVRTLLVLPVLFAVSRSVTPRHPAGCPIQPSSRPTRCTALPAVNPPAPTKRLAPATALPGQTLTLLEADGPGMISHMWFTINDAEPYHLKRIVLRIYWDGEESPSVRNPHRRFPSASAIAASHYGWQSPVLDVRRRPFHRTAGSPCPTPKHARVTITNEGKQALQKFSTGISTTARTRIPCRPALFISTRTIVRRVPQPRLGKRIWVHQRRSAG